MGGLLPHHTRCQDRYVLESLRGIMGRVSNSPQSLKRIPLEAI